MINEITVNNNNAIEMSRGELLQWVNNTLKINYTKIEQLGTGSAYCQFFDILYPGKIPLGKVNWKAKNEYEYINNFKVLQQAFIKNGIMKNIEVEKLVKCKYQDNLEFLQWFKKIFDVNYSNKDYDPITRRADSQAPNTKRQSSKQQNTSIMPLTARQNNIVNENSKIIDKKGVHPDNISFEQVLGELNKGTNNAIEQGIQEQKLFYQQVLKKIQSTVSSWDRNRPSQQLVEVVRQILLTPPPMITQQTYII